MAAYGPAEDRDWLERGDGDEDLLELIRALPGDDPERQKACEIIVGRYANIVQSCVRQYRGAPEPAEDLMQVGYVGLMKAINNYDPAVGHGLAAYAQPCVSGEIKRHFRDKRWQIRVQRPVQELRLLIRAAVPDLTHQLSRPPSDAELAVHLGVTEAEITAAQLASQVFQIASLDAPAGADDSGETAGDLLGSEDPGLEHAIDMEAVWKHYGELPAREQRLLMMRFYGNMTQAQIGQQLGMSQMHVSRLLGRALAYLREKVTGLTEPVTE
jgi:RNA polymerase sigma-70 factor (sigma-B/F/G subfamily)